MTKKNILICVIIVAIILVSVYFFISNNNSGETNTNLQTNSASNNATRVIVSADRDLYTDPNLQISFEMPKEWHVRTTVDNVVVNGVQQVIYSGNMISVESSDKPLYRSSGKGPEDENLVSLTGTAVQFTRSLFSNETLTDYLNQQYGEGEWTFRKERLADGIEADRVDFTGGVKDYATEYYFINKGWLYHIGIVYENTDSNPLAEEVISSFKLIDI